MASENEMAVVPEVRYDLTMARAPKQVLAEAQEAAKALQTVVSNRKNAVKFNGKQYLQFEDWQTCGRFYGVTAKIISTEPCEMDGIKGFIARAEAINTQTGAVLSAAESMCMNDEPNWAKKPLFQLRSMAQTRAAAKSLRNCLAWVVVLAGYEPSVAEEMTGEEEAAREPIKPPQAKTDVKDNQEITFLVKDIKTVKTGKTSKGTEWTLWAIDGQDGNSYSTLDEKVIVKAEEAKAEGLQVSVIWKMNEKGYRQIVSLGVLAPK